MRMPRDSSTFFGMDGWVGWKPGRKGGGGGRRRARRRWEGFAEDYLKMQQSMQDRKQHEEKGSSKWPQRERGLQTYSFLLRRGEGLLARGGAEGRVAGRKAGEGQEEVGGSGSGGGGDG